VAFGLGPARGAGNGAARAEALCRCLRPGLEALHWCRQVHGTEVRLTDAARAAGAACVGDGDGLVTTSVGVAVAVWTADCVPVLVGTAAGVAAVHSGWRGTASGVVRRAVEALAEATGSARHAMWAFIGPAVGPCHYPVGPEVVAELRATGVAEGRWLHPERRVDLRAVVRAQLLACGVPARRVALVGGCTACSPDLASYRRDGAAAGRQLSLTYLVAGEATLDPRS
jgi:YfiH family protein